MKRIENARKAGQTIGVALGGALTDPLVRLLEPSGVSYAFITVLIIGLILICAKGLEWVTSEMIYRSSFFRRLIVGPQFIEGTWLDYADIGEGYYGLVDIQYTGGELMINGDAFTLQGYRVFRWKSQMYRFDGSDLEYVYRSKAIGKGTPHQERKGLVSIVFHRETTGKKPTHFSGTYTSIGKVEGNRTIQGVKLRREEVKRLRHKPDCIHELLKQHALHILPSGDFRPPLPTGDD